MAYSKEHYENYVKPWMKKNKERVQKYRKDADLKKKYGITLDDYNELARLQNYVCKICQKPETQSDVRFGIPYQLAVDHCHETGKIRGLLCSKCNRSLGLVEDSVEQLHRLIQYLNESNRT